MGLRPAVEWLGAPIFIVLQAAPVAALIPLVTFVYGIGLTAKTLSVCLLALPVIVLNSYKAVRTSTRRSSPCAARSSARRRQQIVKIVLPDAAPLIFAGLRLGVSAGFIGVVLAELLITPTGIGDLITFHRSTASYPEMYADIASHRRLLRPDARGAAMGRDPAVPSREAGALTMQAVSAQRRSRATPAARRAAPQPSSQVRGIHKDYDTASRLCATSTSTFRAAR